MAVRLGRTLLPRAAATLLTRSRALTTAPPAILHAVDDAPPLPPFDHVPAKYMGPPPEEVYALRKQFLSPALFHYYGKPLMIVEGKGQYLFDETGRRYLDCFAGIVTVSVGHSHPEVVRALSEQAARLMHTTTIYLNDQVALYAKELAAKMPGDLKVCYFVNSGSEANDLALLMARVATGNHDVLALRNAYHGASPGTVGLTAHSTWKFNVPQGAGVHHALNPDPYRGAFGTDGARYAEDVKDLIATATPGRVAAFFAETIQGVGGTIELAAGYLPPVYEAVRAAGGLCVADEVQTGFGRTGSAYWGFQNQGVVPDIVTLAKGIGNGFPMGAVVTTPAVASVMNRKLHFNTFGGNPMASAVGRAVLRVIDTEGLQEHCATLGDYLKDKLVNLAGKHALIGDVRGAGLMLGVELVTDRAAKTPAKAETARALERMAELGALVGKGGLHGNVFRIKPPMCFNQEDADFLVDVMDRALTEIST